MNIKREGPRLFAVYVDHTHGDPRCHHPFGQRKFLHWLREDDDRHATWRRFADLYEATEEDAILIAVGLAASEGIEP